MFLEDVKKGKAGTSSTLKIQTKNCVFLPYVSVAQLGQTLHFQNWDPIQHKLSVFMTSKQGAQFLLEKNLQPHPENRKSNFLSEGQTGLHRPGPEIQHLIDTKGILVFRCRLHDYMEGMEPYSSPSLLFHHRRKRRIFLKRHPSRQHII